MATKTKKKTSAPQSAVALLRVSTSRQADSGLGLDAQLKSIQDYAKDQDIKIERVIREEGVSGGLSLEKRLGLLEALNEVEAGAILIVAKRDRLSRDPLVSMTIESLLRKKQARVVSVAGEGTDSDDPSMILLRRLTDIFAEHEKLLIGARTKKSLQAKKAKGHYLGRVPFGYKRFRNKLVEVPEEQAVIAKAKALREQGINYYQIAKALTKEQIYNSNGVPYQGHQIKSWLEREK